MDFEPLKGSETQQLSRAVQLHRHTRHVSSSQIFLVYTVSIPSPQVSAVFTLDFHGSENLTLEDPTPGNANSEHVRQSPIRVKRARMRLRSKVCGPAEEQSLATLRVEDSSKRWRVEERLTWVERYLQQFVKEVAEEVTLETVDLYAKGRSLIGMEYWARVNKPDNLIFDVDVRGSNNLALSNGSMLSRTSLQAYTSTNVATVYICDPDLPWKLSFDYSWREEPAEQISVGQVTKQKLEPGLDLEVTRVNERVVKYTAISTKSTPYNVVLDCSQCQNMQLISGASSRRSVAFPNRACELGCVEAIDVEQEWTLDVTISWATGNKLHRSKALSPPPSTVATDQDTKTNGASSLEPVPVKEVRVKHGMEEIEAGILLSTEQFASSATGTRIVYTLDVRKDSRVTFSIDFSTSTNLRLLAASPDSSMTQITCVQPFSRVVVAELVARDNSANRSWKLKCSYKWRAQATNPPSFTSSTASSTTVRPGSSPSSDLNHNHNHNHNHSSPSLEALLASLQLERYRELLRRNEMDLGTLNGLTHEMLEALLMDCGITNHRHRDQIVAAIKQI